MSAKPDAKEKDAAAPEKAAPAAASKGGIGKWIPAIAALILAPACSWAVVQFVMLPKLQKQIAAAQPASAGGEGGATGAEEAPAAESAGGGKEASGGKEAKDGKGGNTYDFQNVVVNLAGTMGTRYLKTSFTVTGLNGNFKTTIESNKARLTDVTLNVLSSLTLADLEEPGSKNVLRDKLVAAYNQVLGARVVDQVYFADFLIQ